MLRRNSRKGAGDRQQGLNVDDVAAQSLWTNLISLDFREDDCFDLVPLNDSTVSMHDDDASIRLTYQSLVHLVAKFICSNLSKMIPINQANPVHAASQRDAAVELFHLICATPNLSFGELRKIVSRSRSLIKWLVVLKLLLLKARVLPDDLRNEFLEIVENSDLLGESRAALASKKHPELVKSLWSSIRSLPFTNLNAFTSVVELMTHHPMLQRLLSVWLFAYSFQHLEHHRKPSYRSLQCAYVVGVLLAENVCGEFDAMFNLYTPTTSSQAADGSRLPRAMNPPTSVVQGMDVMQAPVSHSSHHQGGPGSYFQKRPSKTLKSALVGLVKRGTHHRGSHHQHHATHEWESAPPRFDDHAGPPRAGVARGPLSQGSTSPASASEPELEDEADHCRARTISSLTREYGRPPPPPPCSTPPRSTRITLETGPVVGVRETRRATEHPVLPVPLNRTHDAHLRRSRSLSPGRLCTGVPGKPSKPVPPPRPQRRNVTDQPKRPKPNATSVFTDSESDESSDDEDSDEEDSLGREFTASDLLEANLPGTKFEGHSRSDHGVNLRSGNSQYHSKSGHGSHSNFKHGAHSKPEHVSQSSSKHGAHSKPEQGSHSKPEHGAHSKFGHKPHHSKSGHRSHPKSDHETPSKPDHSSHSNGKQTYQPPPPLTVPRPPQSVIPK